MQIMLHLLYAIERNYKQCNNYFNQLTWLKNSLFNSVAFIIFISYFIHNTPSYIDLINAYIRMVVKRFNDICI